MEKEYISWKQYDKDIRILANKIKEVDFKFNFIGTLSRGGLPIATHLSHLLNDEPIEVDTFALAPEPILIVDDVSDTGKALSEILIHRKDRPKRIATLYRKDGTTVEPDYYARTINKWIVFPWEK